MFFPKWKLELCSIIRTKSKRISVCILPLSGTHWCRLTGEPPVLNNRGVGVSKGG